MIPNENTKKKHQIGDIISRKLKTIKENGKHLLNKKIEQ